MQSSLPLLLIAFFIFLFPLNAQAQLQAQAELMTQNGEPAGTVQFFDEDKAVRIEVKIFNLPAGKHALHIHENPSCEGPDFKSAGGHFNPQGKAHGFLNSQGHHAGDLPNISVKEDGRGEWTFVTDQVTLAKEAQNSLFRIPGTSVVIHQAPDDYFSDPSAKGDLRLACGPIKETKR